MERSAKYWDISLSSWIIQDGNYSDFHVGQVAEFAVEFWISEGVHISPTDLTISAVHQGDCLYNAIAECVLHTDDFTVLDIGFLVYEHTQFLKADFSQHSRYALRLGLGIDPFSYDDLIYSWRIVSIFRQTAPFVEIVIGGTRVRYRDLDRLSYVPISVTNASTDDRGSGEYILRCERLAFQPERESKTAL